MIKMDETATPRTPESTIDTHTTIEDPEAGAAAVVGECIAAGEAAMMEVTDYDQDDADDLARAAAWGVYQEDHAESLVETTLEATGLGNAADKRPKVREWVKTILEAALDEPSVGRIPCDDPGVVEIAKPVGVVGGLVPSTNPVSTVANLAILALKGRNALVYSASPAGLPPTMEAVGYIREELAAVGAPRDLVQVLPAPASKPKSNALLDQADLVQVTGSAANVRAGQESGTPNYCVGEGNPVALVDTGANIERVAATTIESAAYDGGTVCAAESCAVAPEAVYAELRGELAAAGGYRCDAAATERLRETLFPDGSGPDRAVIGRSAPELAAEAGFDVPDETTTLLVEPTSIDADPLVTECLSPVLATLSVPDFAAGLDAAERILDRAGAGHSVSVHTDDRERALRAGRRLGVCRMVVNQPDLNSSGLADNGLTPSLSMGGGTWAGNQLEHNLSCREFIQTTQVAFPVESDDPDDATVFAPYLEDADANTATKR
jgi:sulfoacetaldehyde dehydrogenase